MTICRTLGSALALVVLASAAKIAGACDSPAPVDRSKLSADEVIVFDVHKALHERQFAQLDAWAAEYARPGQPKLSRTKIRSFYDAFNPICHGRKPDLADLKLHQALLVQWAKVSVEPVVPVTTNARLETAAAWNDRGGGYAHTVTPEQWEKFHAGIARAELMLRSVAPAGRNHAEWFAEMLDVALAQGWDLKRYDEVFNAAIAAFPDTYRFYDDKSIYMEARWHGSDEKLKEFVEQSVKKKGGDDGKFLYARLYLSRFGPDLFTSGRADWNRMKEGLEILVERYPERVNFNAYARFACLANDMETFDAQAARAGGPEGRISGDMKFYHDCWRSRELARFQTATRDPMAR